MKRMDPVADVRMLTDAGHPIAKLRNPLTATWVTLTPPFEYETMAETEGLLTRFAAFCVAGWNLARLDPQEIDGRFGWNHEPDEAAFLDRVMHG